MPPRWHLPWFAVIGIVFVMLLLLVAGLNGVLVRGRDRFDQGCLRWEDGVEVLMTGADCATSPTLKTHHSTGSTPIP
ncbi:hypothetical protein [Spirulina major]|uniref:hypothetical protein n=1 Tax=Spirulina major TaxID=270636 RepID=UPI0009334A1C|nr:hypothetical protein [Spirulina major]